ncbi:uncharacterized protein LOC122628992 [Vespula pensylvanica]|uniref:Uncharacterized protein n=1 Tax=Vespula pensylvanica TaxID=30213 RepID=A0A834UCD6_VESPE|nr:uncharacterized protein LOC122628992 [Vespula pensylvanica]KAF7429854.1 hypothetical protein H0235_006252 [Vespula pensylvanica]
MPACSSENFSKYWSTSSPISRSNSASPLLPGTPLSTSPPLSPPISTLKRSTSNVSNSSNASNLSQTSSNSSTVILSSRHHHYHHYHHHHHQQQQQQQTLHQVKSKDQSYKSSFFARIFYWYLGLIPNFLKAICNVIIYAIWTPTIWVSVVINLFWTIIQLPLTSLKWFLTILYTQSSERARNKRCVLISGGSTVQAVHLARNFYKAGARVVVCELDGLFGLAKFSTACSKFYTVPRPGPGSAAEYVKALKDIVKKEKAAYYIPVSITSTAYYDALAKPYLENMGCECFVPSASEVTALDDPLEVLRRCRSLGLQTPDHFVLRSVQDVSRLYEDNTFRTGRYVMLAAGPAGMRDRAKIVLPSTSWEFMNQQHEISETKPWVVIRDPGGDHFITCTTVKESRIVANVTCRVDESQGLILENRTDVTQWLDRFFARSFATRINGHLSFRLAICENQGPLVCIGCRIGVSLPYVCHTGIHPRLVWRPCRHFSRENSTVLISNDRQQHEQTTDGTTNERSTNKRSIGETSPRLLGTVIDKREALFVYWDPLPYCAYYHLQLPFRRVAGAIRAQPARHNPPLAVVQ